jgi:hypothetical protein
MEQAWINSQRLSQAQCPLSGKSGHQKHESQFLLVSQSGHPPTSVPRGLTIDGCLTRSTHGSRLSP